MRPHRQILGNWGEDLAVDYLQAKGYCILERKLRTRYGEVDILARKGEVLVFVEVKTRTASTFGHPEEAVTPHKQIRLLAVAESYLANHPESGDTWQFDVVAIERRPGHAPEILHFENVIGGS